MKKRGVFLLGLMVFFCYCTILCGCNLSSEADKKLCPDTVFVSELWKNSEIERGRMVNDLIKNNRLKELSKDSVINLLGTPSEDANHFINYLFDMNCGKKKYGSMLFHVEIDSITNKVTDCFLTD